jgi:glycerophosphoryl diester phosphodiesterase
MRTKTIKSFLLVPVILGTLYLILLLVARPAPTHPFFSSLQNRPLVIAHRGGAALWPENTLVAFKAAAEMGVDILEMDIHSTSDGILVVIHDDQVDRTTDGSGEVSSLTIEKIKALDAGYNWTSDEGLSYPFRAQGVEIPTLEEVFIELPDRHMNIEIKQAEAAIVLPFCELIRKYNRQERVLVASFDPRTLLDFRQACPEVASSATSDEIRLLYILSQAGLGAIYRPPTQALQVPEYSGDTYVLHPRLVTAAQAKNLQVHAWTINDVPDMRRMLEAGLDGLITNYPDRMLALLGR